MKIIVKVKTKAKEERIERINQSSFNFSGKEQDTPIYKISVKEAPEKGRANVAVIKLLAKYFDISPISVTLISGQTSKQKIFEIV